MLDDLESQKALDLESRICPDMKIVYGSEINRKLGLVRCGAHGDDAVQPDRRFGGPPPQSSPIGYKRDESEMAALRSSEQRHIANNIIRQCVKHLTKSSLTNSVLSL